MSKKPRRQRRPNLPPEAFYTPMPGTSASATSAAPRTGADPVPQAGVARRVGPINWQQEYGDVLGDLRRTAILAVIMMAAMGVLSFFLR